MREHKGLQRAIAVALTAAALLQMVSVAFVGKRRK